jgi:hypothetical protein
VRRYAWLVVLALSLPVDRADAQTSPECTGTLRAVSGLVLDETGYGRPRKAVQLRTEDGREYVALTEPDGRYAFKEVCPGTYQIQIVGDPYPAASGSVTVGDADVNHNVVRRANDGLRGATGFTAIAIVFFWAGLLLFRHHNIVRTTHELLLAHIENLATRILLESDAGAHAAVKALSDRTFAIKGEVEAKRTWWEWFFWSRGHELAAFVRLHEIERQVVAFLSPEERVVERAVYAETELRQLNLPEATSLADRIRVSLQALVIDAGHGGHASGHALEHLKQQLAEGLAVIYDQRDTGFSGLMEWHNKAMFLAYLALLTIMALGLVFHHEELFLIGAAGGLMSRMARSMFREDVPTDYGASWTTLFLSPLLGAISAWVGIAAVILAGEVNVLDEELLRTIDWNGPTGPVMIALAFLLGFSERFFMSLLSQIEGKVMQPRTGQASVPPAPPSPFAPATSSSSAAAGTATTTVSRENRIAAELDLSSGEHVAFIGDPASQTRATLVQLVGAANVHDLTIETIASKGRLQAVLFEGNIPRDELPRAADLVGQVIDPDGRVVFVGTISATQFEADADTQRQLTDAGPAVVKEVMTTTAGMRAQEPPAKLNTADPVEWIVSFSRPAPGSGD